MMQKFGIDKLILKNEVVMSEFYICGKILSLDLVRDIIQIEHIFSSPRKIFSFEKKINKSCIQNLPHRLTLSYFKQSGIFLIFLIQLT